MGYCLLFDFDYTLVDSSAGIVECINYALEETGFQKASRKEICKLIGLTLDDTFIKLTGVKQEEKISEWKALFKQRADIVMNELTLLYPGVAETFRMLKENGHQIGIVSTKFRYRIEDFLRREGILKLVDGIVGGDDVENYKPHPEGVFLAATKLKVSLGQCIFVGDSLTDAQTAMNAGIRFIASLTGATSKNEFKNYPVECSIHTMEELPAFLFQEKGYAPASLHQKRITGREVEFH